MLGHDSIDTGVSGDVADQHLFVHQILAHTLICPVVDQLLEGDVFRPVIWVWHEDGLLDMVHQIATFFDLSIAVVESPGL